MPSLVAGRIDHTFRRVERRWKMLRSGLLDYLVTPEKQVDPAIVQTVRRECANRLNDMPPGPKIFYALTPPQTWPNIGDHAQVAAILRWIAKHFPHHFVFELSKNEAIACIDLVSQHCDTNDIFLLHSGGNLGDRGIWTESGRRSIIRNFPNNEIVSLPQTISFTATRMGQRQRQRTAQIYRRHKRLTLISRDPISAVIAAEMFPNAQLATMPDFVLSLNPLDFGVNIRKPTNGKILACLRRDDESNIDNATLSRLLSLLGSNITVFDTHMTGHFDIERRDKIIKDTLELFSAHDGVVTDRFHGSIFAVLCRKPTVILPTIDHKLTSGAAWFEDIKNVAFGRSIEDVPDLLREVISTSDVEYPDFNDLYFDRLPALFHHNRGLE